MGRRWVWRLLQARMRVTAAAGAWNMPPTQVAQRRQQLFAVQPAAAVCIVAAEHLGRQRQVAAAHCGRGTGAGGEWRW